MLEQSVIGLVAGIIGFLGFVPYILDTISRRTRPNRATWIIWAVLGIIIAASYYASGARDTAWTPIAYALGIFFVMALSFRYGEDGWTRIDKACLICAATGLLLWWLTDNPLLTLYLMIFVDAAGAVPTIRKTYEKPESESRVAWAMFLAGNTLNLFAVGEWTAAIASYPVYLFVLDIIMIALACRKAGGRRKPTR